MNHNQDSFIKMILKTNLNYMKLQNPFQVKTKHPIEIETMLMEYIKLHELVQLHLHMHKIQVHQMELQLVR